MSQISRRRFLCWSAIASGTALLGSIPRWANGADGGTAGAAPTHAKPAAQVSGEPIKIGIIDPLTSPYKTSSIHDVHGATVAVDLYNKQVGVLGRPVAIVEADDASNPETAAKAALKLIKTDRVDFLMGTFNGDCALGVSEVAKQEHKLFMVTGSHLPALARERCDAHMFVFMPSATMLSNAVAPYIVKEYGQRWFMVTADTVDGRSAERAMAEACGAQQGEVLGSVTTPFGATDFTEAVTKAKAANPQAVILNLYGWDLVNALKACAKLEFGKDKIGIAGMIGGEQIGRPLGYANNAGIWGWSGTRRSTRTGQGASSKRSSTSTTTPRPPAATSAMQQPHKSSRRCAGPARPILVPSSRPWKGMNSTGSKKAGHTFVPRTINMSRIFWWARPMERNWGWVITRYWGLLLERRWREDKSARPVGCSRAFAWESHRGSMRRRTPTNSYSAVLFKRSNLALSSWRKMARSWVTVTVPAALPFAFLTHFFLV